MTMKWILSAALLTATACSTTVSYAPFRQGPIAQRVSADAVEVFYTPPRCAFVELGMLESQATFSSMAEGLAAMRSAAASRGADGVILVDHQDGSGGGHTTSTTHISRAIAIQRDASCASDVASQYRGQPYGRSTAPGAR